VIAIPAIDLSEGACVQLVGGSFDDERVRLADPLAVAVRWRDAGFSHLHVVDLDAAVGSGSNATVIAALLDTSPFSLQIGGGIRDERAVARWLTRGSVRVVVGTRAIEDPEWLVAQARTWPGRLVVALDVRGERVQVRGWSAGAAASLADLLSAIESVPVGAVLITAIDVEGRLAGPDLALMQTVRSATPHAVIASGGIASCDDLDALAALRVDAAVIGMALYTGALDARTVARRFAA
jgi:phosphoribosylformimino-5-aminoimidazole carboxamide ribotide isomerase